MDFFNYSFIIHGLLAGSIIALVAPLLGIFLVLRRYSLIADTLSHVSLMGVALGLFFKIPPVVTAIVAATTASLLIEKLRLQKKLFGESALSLFLSGSLALAVVLIGLAKGFSANLFSYLFGSIVTVSHQDVVVIAVVGGVVLLTLVLFFKELFYITFDEESAQVSGLPVVLINYLFMFVAALTIALSIPIVGVLLVSALIVIPVISSLQFKQSFIKTIIIAEGFSLVSMLCGIILSFYLDLPAGGTVVLFCLVGFIFSYLFNR